LRTGFTADVCFVRVIEGMTDALERQTCELSLMDCLSKSGIVPEEVEINEAAALHRAGICVVHATSAPAAIALIVDGIHLERAQAVIAAR